MGLFLSLLISTIQPLAASNALREKLSKLKFINDDRLELLNDLPLEKINIDSRMLVFPEPLVP